MTLAMGHCMFAGTHGDDAVSAGCFNPAVVIGIEVASIHLGLGYCLGCRLGCELLWLVGLEVAGTQENMSNNSVGFAVRRVIVAGAYGAGAVPGECFNPAVVVGLVVANIHSSFGFGFVGALRCRLLMLVGSKGTVAKENKNYHSRFFVMGYFTFVGTHGADAVSGDCSNLAVDFGLEVASFHLGFG